MKSLLSRLRAWYTVKDTSPIFPPETTLLTLEDFVPEDFVQGVEILNDHTTPMPFVVHILQQHLHMSKSQAIETMLKIHEKGGKIIALESQQAAETIAQKICDDARIHGHSLVCRAISTLPRDNNA